MINIGHLSHKIGRTRNRYFALFISFKYLKIFNISLGFSSFNSFSTLKDEMYYLSPFQIWNWTSQKSDQYSLSDEVLVLALTEGLATFVKNPIPRSKYNLAISSDFSLSLRMIPAFDLHYLIVLQTTDEPSFLGNYFNTTFTSIGKLSPKQNLVNFTCWELWWFSPIWFVVAIL